MFFHLVHLRFADAVHSWQAYPRSNVGSFSEYPIGGHMMPIGLNSGDVNWFSWFRWGLPGVCTRTMLFSQSCYIYRPVDLSRFAHGWKPRGHRLYVCFSHHCVVSSCHHVSYFVGAQQHLLSKWMSWKMDPIFRALIFREYGFSDWPSWVERFRQMVPPISSVFSTSFI